VTIALGICLALYLSTTGLRTICLSCILLKIKENAIRLGGSFATKTIKAELYFGDENSDMLIREYRAVHCASQPERRAETVIAELIKGPNSKGARTLPMQTRLKAVAMRKNGQIDIDFGPEISQYHPGGTSAELLTVMSIVNTITANVKEVQCVRILINGVPIDTLNGHVDCSQPFVSNMQIVR